MLRFVLVALALLLPGGAVAVAPATARVSDPFTSSTRLYVDPSEPAAQQARAWRTSRPADAALMDRIATRPVATWLGDWNPDVRKDAAALAARVHHAGAIPVVVAYDIPQRDCGSYSAGGAHSEASYRAWIAALAVGEHVLGPIGAQQQHPRPANGSRQVMEQLQRGGAGPVEVIQHQHQGP